MTYSEYSGLVKRAGHFCVTLGDNQTPGVIGDKICELVFDKWLIPLLAVSSSVFIYQRSSGHDVSEEITPPPKGLEPVLLGKTQTRLELDPFQLMNQKYRPYWFWAMRHRNKNITLVVPKDKFPLKLLAKHSWNPDVWGTLGAVAAGGSIQLSRREATKENVTCIFIRQPSELMCNISPPKTELGNYFKHFVANCQISKDVELEYKPVQREARKS